MSSKGLSVKVHRMQYLFCNQLVSRDSARGLEYNCTIRLLPRGHSHSHSKYPNLAITQMVTHEEDIDALLKARAEIDDQLRKHKNTLTVLFTDVAGSTSFFERNGDTAGLAMIHRHDELARNAEQQHAGKVIKTIGDSAMAEIPHPSSAVLAAVEIDRPFVNLNLTLPQSQSME